MFSLCKICFRLQYNVVGSATLNLQNNTNYNTKNYQYERVEQTDGSGRKVPY